jgi:hypothetical protein
MMRFETPWGQSALVRFLSSNGDVVRVESPGHGGDGVRTDVPMPPTLAGLGVTVGNWRWFEEDVAWAAVAIAFPALYQPEQVELATSTLRDWFPDEYSAHFGVQLDAQSSRVLEQREWEQATRGSFCVTAGFGSQFWDVPAGYVYACGFRASDEAVAGFLVPEAEYANPMRLILDAFPRWEPNRTLPYLKAPYKGHYIVGLFTLDDGALSSRPCDRIRDRLPQGEAA